MGQYTTLTYVTRTLPRHETYIALPGKKNSVVVVLVALMKNSRVKKVGKK